VSGICHGVSPESHNITYAVGACPTFAPTEAFTGWESSFHIIVEELRVDLVKACDPSKPVDCDV